MHLLGHVDQPEIGRESANRLPSRNGFQPVKQSAQLLGCLPLFGPPATGRSPCRLDPIEQFPPSLFDQNFAQHRPQNPNVLPERFILGWKNDLCLQALLSLR